MEERLQKIISAAGIASRRKAEIFILAGEVSLNGKVVKELGTKADVSRDKIVVCGKLLKPTSRKIYIALHKPTGFISTLFDPQGRKTVKDLLPSIKERVFPVGRLDYDSEGLMIMTNDGDFAFKVAHPKFKIAKRYIVEIDGEIDVINLTRLREGIDLEDGQFRALDAVVTKTSKKSSWVLLAIEEGRNRIVRRAFAELGFEVKRLVRVAIGTVTIADIKAGEYRHISKQEINSLLQASENG